MRRQSEHMPDYAAALSILENLGVVYPCFCTRAAIAAEIAAAGAAPHGTDGPRYPGTCRRLDRNLRAERVARGDGHAFRLDAAKAGRMAESREPLTWHDQARGRQIVPTALLDDVVLARKETPTSYHLAVTADDALQGVTLVTRGEDLFDATHIHRVLQALLDLPVPDYHHHRLLTDAQGRRFAKRDKSLTLRALREAGKTPAEVRALARFD
jgi:glutamyl-Q tRNA(Asp) synthetase